MSCKLLFGGDIAPLRPDGAGMFGDLAPLIEAADLAVANLEFALADAGRPARGKLYPHKGSAALVDSLSEAGFDAVNLANNHMLDYGEEALVETIANLDRAGIAHFGGGHELNGARAPVVIERGGLRIGLLGCTTTLPQGFAAEEDRPGVNPLRVLTSYRQFRNPDEYPGTAPLIDTEPVAEDLERFVSDIRRLKERSDIVLAYVHWGTSMTETVHDFQRVIGRAAIDAGAAVVLGGHQHVISAVELYRGAPIVHGLGNLVFDFEAPFFTEATRRTIVFGATMTHGGLEDCHLFPCRTGVNGPVRILDPDSGEGAEIFSNLARISEPHGCRLTAEGDRITMAAA